MKVDRTNLRSKEEEIKEIDRQEIDLKFAQVNY